MTSRNAGRRRRLDRAAGSGPTPPDAPRHRVSRWRFAVVSAATAATLATIIWGVKSWTHRPIQLESFDSRDAVGGNLPRPDSHRSERRRTQAFDSLVNRGTDLLGADQPEQALQVLNEARRLDPGDEDVHYDLGLTLARLGRTQDAIGEYEEALRLYPQYLEAHNNLGNLLMRSGKLEPAIEHFQTALGIMPDYASAHNNLGTALQRAGRTNEAILHFEKAARLKPDYWQAHFNFAGSCLGVGRLDEARSELQTVLRLNPNFEPAKAALSELDARGTRP